MWTRIYHVRPHSIGETRFYFGKVKILVLEKIGVATYFYFYFKEKP